MTSSRTTSRLSRPTAAILASVLLLFLAPAAAATLVPDGPRIEVGPVGDGFSLDEIGALGDQQPFLVMDDDGGFLVFWWQIDSDPERPEAVARKYMADGTPAWTTRTYWDPVHDTGAVGGLDDVGGNGAGDFVIGWLSDEDGYRMRAFDVCGDPLADTIDIGLGSVPDGLFLVGVKNPRVGISDDRDLVVAFVQELVSAVDPPDDGNVETFARAVIRRYDLDGVLSSPEIEGPTGASLESLDLAVDGDGAFSLIVEQLDATDTPFLTLESYDATGDRLITPPPADPHPAESRPSLAYEGGGHLMVAFEDAGAAGACTGLSGRFRDDGQPLGDDVQVESAAQGCPSWPAVAGLANGWVTLWEGGDGGAEDSALAGVRVRSYAADGSPVGAALRVLPSAFVGPAALAAAGDRAVVAAVMPPRSGGAPQLVVQRLGRAGEVACGPGGVGHMCFQGDRFRVDADWRNPYEAGGSGLARARGIEDVADSGAFWFFREENLELLVKVLDGRGVNGHYWVFFGSLSTVEFWVAVTDLASGEQRVYHNPAFEQASVADAAAFEDPLSGGGSLTSEALAASSVRGWELVAAVPAAGVVAGPAVDLAAPARVAAPLTPPFCGTTDEQLCLRDAFAVTVSWKNPRNGEEGVGHTIPLTGDTGAFWFFREDNAELMVKVLDGTAINGHYWVFYAGLSDVEYTISVDPPGSEPVIYTNAPFELRSGADTAAIAEDDAF